MEEIHKQNYHKMEKGRLQEFQQLLQAAIRRSVWLPCFQVGIVPFFLGFILLKESLVGAAALIAMSILSYFWARSVFWRIFFYSGHYERQGDNLYNTPDIMDMLMFFMMDSAGETMTFFEFLIWPVTLHRELRRSAEIKSALRQNNMNTGMARAKSELAEINRQLKRG